MLVSAPERILAAAESLFAMQGYAEVSLRQITAKAKVNLAAVNYHYYDKEALYREILTRHLRQVNARRLALLAEAEARAHPHSPPVREIVQALARPLFMPDEGLGSQAVMLLGRLLVEPAPFKSALLEAEFHPTMRRFGQVLRRHVPSLPPKDFLWRFSFIVGALHHAAVTMPDMSALTQGLCRSDESELALENFTSLAVQALK